MEKTIKEMADELGVSKQKVYRFIKKNHITTSSEAHQVMWYDEAVQTLVNTHFLPSDTVGTASKPHHEAHQVKRCDDVVQTTKPRQDSQSLHAGTIQSKPEVEIQNAPSEPPESPSEGESAAEH